MTENNPPVRPEPPHPHAGWRQPGPGQSYPSHGPVPGSEPAYGPSQPYTPPGYSQQPYPYPQQQAQYPSALPGWGASEPPKTGVCTASGVLTIVLGTYLLMYAVVGAGGVKAGMASLLFLLVLACLTAGILVLTLRLSRGVQVFALACSGVAALFALIAPAAGYYGIVLPATLLPLAIAGCILSSISLSRGSQSA